MGLISILRSFTRVVRNGAQASDVKIDPSGGANVTAEHFSAPGDDSHPLPDDFAVAVSVAQTGRAAVIGYIDPLNTPKAEDGEKRIYARDPSDGSVVVEVWLKNTGEALTSNVNGSVTLSPDGTIKGVNTNGSFELQAGGDFVVNGVTIDKNGKVTIPTSLNLAGKEIAGHDHAINSGSSAPGPTGSNN